MQAEKQANVKLKSIIFGESCEAARELFAEGSKFGFVVEPKISYDMKGKSDQFNCGSFFAPKALEHLQERKNEVVICSSILALTRSTSEAKSTGQVNRINSKSLMITNVSTRGVR